MLVRDAPAWLPFNRAVAAGVESLCGRGRIARRRSIEEAVLSEYVQFAVVMAVFIAILIGSYGFMMKASGSPDQAQKERQSQRESEAD